MVWVVCGLSVVSGGGVSRRRTASQVDVIWLLRGFLSFVLEVAPLSLSPGKTRSRSMSKSWTAAGTGLWTAEWAAAWAPYLLRLHMVRPPSLAFLHASQMS